jgi:predicted  nucleic acid-binding Zn-ribbon protein
LIHPQLTLLMELQDLRGQLRELADGGESETLEQEHFQLDPEQARSQLALNITDLEDTLSTPIRSRYQRILPTRDRVVVPVIHGVCYGCFVSIPTATAGDSDAHQDLQSCESCGRFIYILP